jgi:hypothetical protein
LTPLKNADLKSTEKNGEKNKRKTREKGLEIAVSPIVFAPRFHYAH